MEFGGLSRAETSRGMERVTARGLGGGVEIEVLVRVSVSCETDHAATRSMEVGGVEEWGAKVVGLLGVAMVIENAERRMVYSNKERIEG